MATVVLDHMSHQLSRSPAHLAAQKSILKPYPSCPKFDAFFIEISQRIFRPGQPPYFTGCVVQSKGASNAGGMPTSLDIAQKRLRAVRLKKFKHKWPLISHEFDPTFEHGTWTCRLFALHLHSGKMALVAPERPNVKTERFKLN